MPRLTGFEATFDRRLSPDSVDRRSLAVQSGDRQELLSLRVDPVDRILVATTFSGRALQPGVLYRLVVDRVRDLDGVEMTEPVTAVFRTSDALGEEPSEPSATWADVAPVLATACAGAGCHEGERPALGLDLSSAEGVRTTALGLVARQTETGTAGAEAGLGVVGLTGMAIVDVHEGRGSPSRSYLLYKMLGDGHILGQVMPPEGPLERDTIQTISAWILDGAPTE